MVAERPKRYMAPDACAFETWSELHSNGQRQNRSLKRALKDAYCSIGPVLFFFFHPVVSWRGWEEAWHVVAFGNGGILITEGANEIQAEPRRTKHGSDAAPQPCSSLQHHVTSPCHHINHMAAGIKWSICNGYKWCGTQGQCKVVAPGITEEPVHQTGGQRKCLDLKKTHTYTQRRLRMFLHLPLHKLKDRNWITSRQGQKRGWSD